MWKLFLLSSALALSLMIFVFGADQFLTGIRTEHDFWIISVPFVLIGSGGAIVSGTTLIKHIIKYIQGPSK